MRKSVTSNEYRGVRDELRRMRIEAGLTQRELAARMGREQSFIWRLEQGERRLDVLEFFWVCRALGMDAPLAYAALCQHFESTGDYPTVNSPTDLPKVAEPTNQNSPDGSGSDEGKDQV
jgi:transcriptional regulator with XRE-family HTH domain